MSQFTTNLVIIPKLEMIKQWPRRRSGRSFFVIIGGGLRAIRLAKAMGREVLAMGKRVLASFPFISAALLLATGSLQDSLSRWNFKRARRFLTSWDQFAVVAPAFIHVRPARLRVGVILLLLSSSFI